MATASILAFLLLFVPLHSRHSTNTDFKNAHHLSSLHFTLGFCSKYPPWTHIIHVFSRCSCHACLGQPHPDLHRGPGPPSCHSDLSLPPPQRPFLTTLSCLPSSLHSTDLILHMDRLPAEKAVSQGQHPCLSHPLSPTLATVWGTKQVVDSGSVIIKIIPPYFPVSCETHSNSPPGFVTLCGDFKLLSGKKSQMWILVCVRSWAGASV